MRAFVKMRSAFKDIFVYFFEQGVEVLRPGGRLAFITSGSWDALNFGAPRDGFCQQTRR